MLLDSLTRKFLTIRKIVVVLGTRPEAIKMAPLANALRAASKDFQTVICLTGQHRDLVSPVLDLFGVVPDHDLGLMVEGQDLPSLHSSILSNMSNLLTEENPDAVLVHGDTTTTLATAQAAFYRDVPVGHVEAGLRSYNLRSPFPEEMNRQVTSTMSTWHFAPTDSSKENLISEGINEASITVTGNTVVDSLLWVAKKLDDPSSAASYRVLERVNSLPFDSVTDRYILITGHRRENIGEGFQEVAEALQQLSAKFPDVWFVFPLHPNPLVREPIKEALNRLENVVLLEPLGYAEFVHLLVHCELVLTDSGGIQEEAPTFGKKVLVMRNNTERPEGIKVGTSVLVGTSAQKIVSSASEILASGMSSGSTKDLVNPFGDGSASQRIINALKTLNSA